MLYHIQWAPRRAMGGCGFNILLWPAWKDEIAALKLDQQAVDRWRARIGAQLLEEHGFRFATQSYRERVTPEMLRDEPERAALLLHDLRIQWGPWGFENITVPGNACCVGIDRGDPEGVGAPRDGVILTPHNMDTLEQASLALTCFLWLGDLVQLNVQLRD